MRLSAVNFDIVAIAAFLTQTILITVSLIRFNSPSGYKINKFFFLIVLILFAIAWLLTNSRAATLSVFALILLATVISGKHCYTSFVMMIISLAMFIITLSFTRFKDAFILEASSNTGHYALWFEAVNIFLSNPLNGISIGMFPIVMTDYLRFLHIQTYISGTNDAHNMILLTAAEMGIIGIGALLWFPIIFFKDLWKSYLKNRGNCYSSLYLAFL